jgi:hypothetical protein
MMAEAEIILKTQLDKQKVKLSAVPIDVLFNETIDDIKENEAENN